MAEHNGSWLKWGIGIIITFLVMILPFMGNAIVCNDKESRSRDIVIDDKVDKAILEQAVTLAEIKADLKYLKAKVQ
jgi:hypothetical protein